MNTTSGPLLEAEVLEQVVYQRSKDWANFILNVKKIETESSFELSDINDIYSNEDEITGNEAEEVNDGDVLQDITNNLRAKSSGKAGVSLSAQVIVAKSTDDDSELDDLLNRTRQVIGEQERKWKDAGIDRILNTFDAQQIEEKVGGWMRRNRNGSMQLSPCHDINNQTMYRKNFKKPRVPVDIDTNSESDQSIDTERYIRSNRKQRNTSSMTTMTIKTFCMVESKRNALYKKYAYPDLDGVSYCKSSCNISQLQKRLKKEDHHYHNATSRNKLGLGPGSLRIFKRRNLGHKNTNRAKRGNTPLSSSSEDLGISRSLRCKSSRRRRSYHRSFHRDCNNFNYSINSSTSSSSTLSSVGSKGPGKYLHKLQQRPCKRESQCSCYNNERLCKTFTHLADTSTDDWYVENCNTPEKSLPYKKASKSVKKRKVRNTETKVKKDNCYENNNNELLFETKVNADGVNFDRKPTEILKQDQASRCIEKGTRKKHSKTNKNTKCDLNSIDNFCDSQKLLKSGYKQKKANSFRITRSNAKTVDDNIEKKKTLEKDRVLNIIEENSNDAEGAVRIKQTQSNTYATKPMHQEEETFFEISTNIWSSTALTSAENHPKSINILASASTYIDDPAAKPYKKVQIQNTTEDDSDCMLVTSTSSSPYLKQQPNQQAPQRQTPNDILLYTPNDSTLAPAHSLSGGCFHITIDHLTAVIGEKQAKIFLKFYNKKRTFDIKSTVYYRPPQLNAEPEKSSTDSESDDELELFGKDIGQLYEIPHTHQHS